MADDASVWGLTLPVSSVASSDNTIGGLLPAQRNVISNNNDAGVAIDSEASGNVILGNYIGTDATGMLPLGNGVGVMSSGTGTQIGGLTPEGRQRHLGKRGSRRLHRPPVYRKCCPR